MRADRWYAPGLTTEVATAHLTFVAIDAEGPPSGPPAEVQDVADRWRAAGEPDVYRLDVDADGSQRATSPNGALTWQLSPGETGDSR
ncbi:hypothetical protein [Streptomyces sp. NBC_01367]|uniref:hypothetical protein n=1 Tax=Streptomyces sp. NBC_01367 TaxID=2903841 RepID=UPI00324B8165